MDNILLYSISMKAFPRILFLNTFMESDIFRSSIDRALYALYYETIFVYPSINLPHTCIHT